MRKPLLAGVSPTRLLAKNARIGSIALGYLSRSPVPALGVFAVAASINTGLEVHRVAHSWIPKPSSPHFAHAMRLRALGQPEWP